MQVHKETQVKKKKKYKKATEHTFWKKLQLHIDGNSKMANRFGASTTANKMHSTSTWNVQLTANVYKIPVSRKQP